MNVWIKTSCDTGVQTAGKNFQKDIYEPAEGTTGLWSHRTRPTKFALCVDDFGVKYFLLEGRCRTFNHNIEKELHY